MRRKSRGRSGGIDTGRWLRDIGDGNRMRLRQLDGLHAGRRGRRAAGWYVLGIEGGATNKQQKQAQGNRQSEPLCRHALEDLAATSRNRKSRRCDVWRIGAVALF